MVSFDFADWRFGSAAKNEELAAAAAVVALLGVVESRTKAMGDPSQKRR